VVALTTTVAQGSHKRTDGDEPDARPSWFRRTFGRRPDLDAETEAFLGPEPTAAMALAITPYRTDETNPDPVAINMIGILAWGMQQKVSATALEERLHKHVAELCRRRDLEKASAKAILHRMRNVTAAAEETAGVLAGAVALERLTGAGPDAADGTAAELGRGLGAMAANARSLADDTMHHIPTITPDMPDPRLTPPAPAASTGPLAAPSPATAAVINAAMAGGGLVPAPTMVMPTVDPESPLHAQDDDTTPPVPTEPAPAPAPLPQRMTPPASDGHTAVLSAVPAVTE
jgi:hypothetical protein